ncbi:MAG: DUF3943 domain-containing protein [Bacteroides sp.]|nr:DUF3943 domain-containing protein [Bacteroides sp.]
MIGRRFLTVMISLAMACAFAAPSFSQNNYDSFLDSLKMQVSHHAYGNKWKRGGYRHRVPYRHIVSTPVVPDSADEAFQAKRHFWRAGAEVFGMNMGLWAFDRYALQGHYAYISWNTIKENFKHGFEWDDDHLNTNMFAHPYNGSLFYNAGRSNGFNFWQSELFAIGGSAMWELFMECEYPSTNDIIATPIGGAALGEVFYRASDLVLNDRATGGERIGREVAAFILDPMRGITRIVSGQAWKHRATSGRRFGLPPISIEASLGARMLTMIENHGFRMGPAAEINLEYGDRFEETTKTPYDYFSFNLELQTIATQPLISRIEIMGRLLSKEVIDEQHINMNIGLYQHFDFFDSDTIRKEDHNELIPETVPYKLGVPASAGGGTMVRFIPNPRMSIDGFAHLNLVALAGVSTDFYRDYHRNYSWGMGFSVKAGLNWALSDDRISVRIANQLYWVRTNNNFDSDHTWTWMTRPNGENILIEGGDNGRTTFDHLEASVNYRLYKNLYLTAGLDFYERHTHYPDISLRVTDQHTFFGTHSFYFKSQQLGAHLMATYKF